MTPYAVVMEWLHSPSVNETDHQGTLELFERLREAGFAIVPKVATEEMLVAAREWSRVKYGVPVGNDGTNGCWTAMVAAAENGP